MTNQTDQPEPTDAEVIAEAETWAHGVRSGPNLTHYPDLRKDARRRLLVLARRGLAAEAARDDKGVSTPTSAEIAAMPARWRRYIMMLETDCDPSGTIRSEMHMREHVEALEARMLEDAKDAAMWRAQEARKNEERAQFGGSTLNEMAVGTFYPYDVS